MVRTAALHRGDGSAVLIAVLTIGLLVGCSAEPVDGPTSQPPTPAPTEPSATQAEVPDVPIQGTGLQPPAPAIAPTRVDVPAVSISLTIEPKGVRADGSMDLPSRVDVAAWYQYGSAPSSPAGSTVIAAHVDSLQYGIGPFSRLVELGAGAEILVTDATGAQRAYALRTIERVAKAEIPLDRVFDRSGPPTLVLITCGGAFDRTSRTYADNILVTADPIAG